MLFTGKSFLLEKREKGEKTSLLLPMIIGRRDVNHAALELAKKYFIVSQHLHQKSVPLSHQLKLLADKHSKNQSQSIHPLPIHLLIDLKGTNTIPHICHFFYTGKIFGE